MLPSLAQTDTVAKLLIDKELITEAEFMEKLSEARVSTFSSNKSDYGRLRNREAGVIDDRIPEWAKPLTPKNDEPLTLDWAETVEARLARLENRLPDTRLLEKNLLARAFAVVGHEMLAYLMILSPILALLGIGTIAVWAWFGVID